MEYDNKVKVEPEIHPIASSRFLLSTTEGVITTRSNRMKFMLVKVKVKSGFFFVVFQYFFISETSSKNAERAKAVNLRKTAKNTKSHPRYLSGKVLRSCYNPTHCQLKDSHSRSQSFDPFAAADQKDRSSGNENEGIW